MDKCYLSFRWAFKKHLSSAFKETPCGKEKVDKRELHIKAMFSGDHIMRQALRDI